MKQTQVSRYTPIPTLFTDIFDDGFFSPHDVLMDKVFGKLFPNSANELGTALFETRAYPKVDIRETETDFILEAEVPGLDKEQIKVEIKDDSLVIRGEKREDIKKEGRFNVKEIKRSSFVRSFTLPPETVQPDSVKAKFKDGILEVTIRKVTPTLPVPPQVKNISIE